MLRENESIYIPQGEQHRLSNPGKILLELVEVQTGSYLGEGRHRPHRGHVRADLRSARARPFSARSAAPQACLAFVQKAGLVEQIGPERIEPPDVMIVGQGFPESSKRRSICDRTRCAGASRAPGPQPCDLVPERRRPPVLVEQLQIIDEGDIARLGGAETR